MPWKIKVEKKETYSVLFDRTLTEFYLIAESPKREVWIKPAKHHLDWAAQDEAVNLEKLLNYGSVKLSDEWKPDYSDMKTNSW